LLAATYVIASLTALRIDWQPVYRDAQSRINRVIEPHDSIMGSQTYWLGLHDHTYYSWEQLVYFQRYKPGSTLEDALREFEPDIFILDRHLDNFVFDGESRSVYLRSLKLPRQELETFLSSHAELIASFENEAYGQVRVFRIAW
jgi:hypothetical protein